MNVKHYLLTLSLLLHTVFLYAQSSVQITRIEGVGAGGNYLEMSPETKAAILDGTFDERILYLPGQGPISIEVTDPDDFTLGTYRLTLVDEDLSNDILDNIVNWQLTHLQSGETVNSAFTITEESEQYVEEFGITIKMVQTPDAGEFGENNGAIAAEIIYDDPSGPQWLSGIPDEGNLGDFPFYNFIQTDISEVDYDRDPGSHYANLGDGLWVPYTLCAWSIPSPNNSYYLTPSWLSPSGASVSFGNRLDHLSNVDIVFTSNKDLWSKCIVVETANYLYYDFGSDYQPEGMVEQLDIRSGASLDKEGNEIQGTGFSWFPGYAIDVETGKRVNIFFGENSVFSCNDDNTVYCDENSISPTEITGGDMLWNPTDERTLESGFMTDNTILNAYDGGQHTIYVTDQEYDECAWLEEHLNSISPTDKIRAMRTIKWTSFSLMEEGQSLLPIQDGLIPNDVTIKLRVDNPFQVQIPQGDGEFNSYPTYEFQLDETSSTIDYQKDYSLQRVTLSPNPYFLESNQQSLLLHHLPSDCHIRIYNLNGQVVSSFTSPANNNTSPTPTDISTHLPQNLDKGVYFVSIEMDNMAKRTLKFIIL